MSTWAPRVHRCACACTHTHNLAHTCTHVPLGPVTLTYALRGHASHTRAHMEMEKGRSGQGGQSWGRGTPPPDSPSPAEWQELAQASSLLTPRPRQAPGWAAGTSTGTAQGTAATCGAGACHVPGTC